jgi:Prp8 binding protein
MSKRAGSPPGGSLIKRVRSSSPGPGTQTQIAISGSNNEREKALMRTVQRTSNLDAPIVSLAGAHGVRVHEAACVEGAY